MSDERTGELSHRLAARFGDQFGEGAPVPAHLEDNPVLLAMAGHCSHRDFTSEPVPPEVLHTLLACALSAPAKSDLQQVGVLQVQSRDKRDQVARLIPSMPWIGTAPEFLVFLGDSRRIRRICELRSKPFANDHVDAMFNAAVDAGLVLMNFARAAEAAGLGCCPVSVVRNHSARIAEILELPQWVFPVAGLALGHPVHSNRITPRLPLGLTLHVDCYDDSAFAEHVDNYDHRRAQTRPIPPGKQRRVEEFGTAEFYGWSEDKARQVSSPERDDFGQFLRDQGFRLE